MKNSNRIIKFRAWDKVDETINEPSTFGEINLNKAIKNYYGKEDSLILMQYTGLKDKNGKEIYEGDILNTYKFGKKIKTFEIKDLEMAILLKFGLETAEGYEFEVIGNKFQNPELLK